MKNFSKIIISIMFFAACSNFAFAAEFTPLNFSDATYNSGNSTKIAATTPASNTTKSVTQNDVKAVVTDTTGSKNMQSAITELDNAQVEVRNELLDYKTKYSEVDAKYNTIKAERAALNKQVKACEKKIRQLDTPKEKIRKNMV